MKHILNIIRKAPWNNFLNKWQIMTDNSNMVEHIIMKQIASSIQDIKTPQIYLDNSHSRNTDESPHDLHLRVGNVQDAAAIFNLEMSGYDGYQAWSKKDFYNDLLANENAVYLLLEDISIASSPELVGMITGRARAKNSHISHLIIHPDYQGYGLGKFLLQLWIKEMEKMQVQTITLEVRESNKIAQNLYHANGFEVTSSKANYYRSNNETALNMRRKSVDA